MIAFPLVGDRVLLVKHYLILMMHIWIRRQPVRLAEGAALIGGADPESREMHTA